MAEIAARGGKAFASHHDVSSTAGADALVAAAIAHFGKVDVLVTNAVVLRDKALIESDDESWRGRSASHCAAPSCACAPSRDISSSAARPGAS